MERQARLNKLDKFIARLDPRWLFSKVSCKRQDGKSKRKLSYTLEIVFLGFISGCKTRRQLETLSSDFGERVPHSTIVEHLVATVPEDLRASNVKLIKRAQRDHVFERNTTLPINLFVIDGKQLSSSRTQMDERFGQKQEESRYEYRALRCMFASQRKPTFIGQRMIPAETGEATQVVEFIKELEEDYRGTNLLDTYSLDAGLCSKEATDYIDLIDRNYIARVKGNQPKMFEAVQQIFSDQGNACITTTEKKDGKTITRALYRSSTLRGLASWSHVTQAWCLQQDTIDSDGTYHHETKYYVTNLKSNELKNDQILLAIRRHWAVENDGFFNLDYAFCEDTYPVTNRALEVVGWMRIISFNSLQLHASRKLDRGLKRAMSLEELFQSIGRRLLVLILTLPERMSPAFL